MAIIICISKPIPTTFYEIDLRSELNIKAIAINATMPMSPREIETMLSPWVAINSFMFYPLFLYV